MYTCGLNLHSQFGQPDKTGLGRNEETEKRRNEETKSERRTLTDKNRVHDTGYNLK